MAVAKELCFNAGVVKIFLAALSIPLLMACTSCSTPRTDWQKVLRQYNGPLGPQVFDGPMWVDVTNDIRALTMVFRDTYWEFNQPQCGPGQENIRDAKLLPDREAWRTDNHIQFWFVPLAEHPDVGAELKSALHPTSLSNFYRCDMAFLGKGRDFAWYAYMPLYDWVHLQKEWHLKQGDNPLAAAIQDLVSEEYDFEPHPLRSGRGVLDEAGTSALPYLVQAFTSTNAFAAFQVITEFTDPSTYKDATALLLSCATSSNGEVVALARYSLEQQLRPEARELYFKWLDEDAGRKWVFRLLEFCTSLDMKRTAPMLPRILAAPKSFHEYRIALESLHSLSGHPISTKLLKAEETIRKFAGWNGASAAGQIILKNLPEQRGPQLIRKLLVSIPETGNSSYERDELTGLLKSLSK
ncbi:MAG: hypothetical protein NTY53_14195 [Kiritimatiellaeota bacterium]|nr:hypothetical protein [Kiritimatiellota bacterium]